MSDLGKTDVRFNGRCWTVRYIGNTRCKSEASDRS
jgi:hypothetical protein